MLFVFDLGFGERRLVVDAPVDGPPAFVNITTLDEAPEQPRRLGLVSLRHRQVRVVPLAENAEPLEVACLPLQGFGGVFATGAADGQRVHL